MIWFLAVLAALFILPLLLLIPKVHFVGEASPERIYLELRGVIFRLTYDNRADTVTGRFLFFKQQPEAAPKQPKAEAESSSTPKMRISIGQKATPKPPETNSEKPETAPKSRSLSNLN